MSDVLRTPYGILCYPALFVPKAPAPGAEPRFSLLIAFDQDALKSNEFAALKAAAKNAAAERWGDRLPSNLRWPFRKTSEKEGQPFDSLPGGVFISAWTKSKPGIVDANRNEVLAPEDVWAGQLVRASLNAFAYDQNGNRGVSFGLRNLQIIDTERPRTDGRANARDEFDAVGGGSNGGSNGGADDEFDDDIPF